MGKKAAKFLLAYLCLAVCAAGLIPMAACGPTKSETDSAVETISVVLDDNYPPYAFRDSQGVLKGILIDQWALWSEKTGVKAEIHAMDWADALDGMRAGQYDVIDTVFFSEERDAWLDFSLPYVTIDVPIFHSNKIGGITDASSLRGFLVAVKAGDNCIPILREAGVTEIAEYPSYEAIIDAAKSGEISVFVVDEPPAIYFLYQKGIALNFSRSESLYSGQFHRAVKKGDAAMLHLVEDGFKRISAEELRVIDVKWFGMESTRLNLVYFLKYILAGIAAVVMAILWIMLWNRRLRREVRKKTAELLHETELIGITLKSIGDGVVATDINGKITLINQTARAMTGWDDDALGLDFSSVLRLTSERTNHSVSSPIKKVLETGETVGLANHITLIRRTGEKIPVADSASPILDEDGNIYGAVMVFRDITQEKAQREQIERIMSHDSMTGLYNRWYMEEQLKQFEQKHGDRYALIMGDLNGLKLINDAFGHSYGDRFIQKVAEILQSSCGRKEIVGRWGGDEFLILMPDADAKAAEGLITKIQTRCEMESDEQLQLSIALGYAVKINTADDIHSVLRAAEQLTYRRKLTIEKSFRSSVINALVSTLAAKSEETEEHADRLRLYCDQIGKILGVSTKELDDMTLFAMLHDIGKVGINDAILRKTGPLTESEWLEMRKHPEIGFRITQNNVDLAPISEYILSHHERWDGQGYPRGLVGDEIPILARILAVVDAFDAMTHERIYKKARSREEAAEEIMRNAGTQFDPHIARVFVKEVLLL
jgi:diguanylate cyclase (GGDEF)-like protein/PAS domain S-box-containing protein